MSLNLNPKIVFRRIEDPAPKRIVETRKISDPIILLLFQKIIPIEKIATFKDIKNQISEVYRRELARLRGIKTKIVLIAHMYRFVGDFCTRHQIDQDIAFPSEILDIICQDRIEQIVSCQYHEILD